MTVLVSLFILLVYVVYILGMQKPSRVYVGSSFGVSMSRLTHKNMVPSRPTRVRRNDMVISGVQTIRVIC